MTLSKTPFILGCGMTVALAGVCFGASAPADKAAVVPLRSVSVDLPAGNRPFPPGPNVNVVSANCVTCHSSGMILNQPKLAPAAWEGEVTKMINVYKAPIDKTNVPAIVAYLTAIKGN